MKNSQTTRRSGEQHGQPQSVESDAQIADDRTVDDAFERAQIAHQHNGNVRSADMDGINVAAGAINPLSEESFVGFNAEVRNESEPRAKEKNTRARGENRGFQCVGMQLHTWEGSGETEMISNVEKASDFRLARRLLANGSCSRQQGGSRKIARTRGQVP